LLLAHGYQDAIGRHTAFGDGMRGIREEIQKHLSQAVARSYQRNVFIGTLERGSETDLVVCQLDRGVEYLAHVHRTDMFTRACKRLQVLYDVANLFGT